MKQIFKKISARATFVALIVFSVGCTTVEPYQKGNLSDYTMRSDRDELASVMNSHIQFSREASTGGEGVGGGGCGCN